MKLNSTQLKQTLSQFEAEVLPEDHPALKQLNGIYGDHTFLLDPQAARTGTNGRPRRP